MCSCEIDRRRAFGRWRAFDITVAVVIARVRHFVRPIKPDKGRELAYDKAVEPGLEWHVFTLGDRSVLADAGTLLGCELGRPIKQKRGDEKGNQTYNNQPLGLNPAAARTVDTPSCVLLGVEPVGQPGKQNSTDCKDDNHRPKMEDRPVLIALDQERPIGMSAAALVYLKTSAMFTTVTRSQNR